MKNGGQCGTCGDPYDDPHPEHEAGGRYATGTIVKYYPQYTSQIPVTIDVTAHHKGKTIQRRAGPHSLENHICGYRFTKKLCTEPPPPPKHTSSDPLGPISTGRRSSSKYVDD